MSATRNPVRVLMVEDSLDQIEIVQAMLAKPHPEPVKLTSATTLAEARYHLLSAPFDVALLDLHLPDAHDLDGVAMLQARQPDIPVIILTNVDDENVAMRAANAGAYDYLLKREITPSLLYRTIRYARAHAAMSRSLKDSEERYALAVAGANDGIWDWRPETGELYLSPRLKRLIGLDESDAASMELWTSRLNPQDMPGFIAAVEAHVEGRTKQLEHEHRVYGRHGAPRWVLCRGLAVRDPSGRATRIAGSLSDITQHKQAQEQLLHHALHDALTRLPNRRLFTDRLAHSIRQLERERTELYAVMFLDLDRFKNVNDSLGHQVGDRLLIKVAERLTRSLRPGDTLARLGGDEFGILLGRVTGHEDAIGVADRILERLSWPLLVDSHELYAAASIGIVIGSAEYKRPDELLRDADLAMYRAKSESASAYCIFDETMRNHAIVRHQVETDLRRALDAVEFVVHYQPIVNVANAQILGFEALIRWRHPTSGLLAPEEFLNVAEDSGMLVPITWWVLEQAMHQLCDWQALFQSSPPLTMSVNVSSKFFSQPDVLPTFTDLVEQYPFVPGSLHLEITEEALLDHGQAVLETLDDLRDLGIELNIDDFGTGFASLTYLQRFAYDTLKIDRSFVGSMLERDDSNAIVKAILALGESLNMKVIAEGVESSAQLEHLRSLHCRQAQGFWFSKPVDAGEIRTLLRDALDRWPGAPLQH